MAPRINIEETLARIAAAVEMQAELVLSLSERFQSAPPPPPPEYDPELVERVIRKLDADRRPLRRMTFIGWANSIPGLAEKFEKVVPETHLTRRKEKKGYSAIVTCPCNGRPLVARGQVVACQCGRWYLGDHEQVRVYRPSEGTDAAEQGSQETAVRVDHQGS